MTTIPTPMKPEPIKDPIVANQKRIENHKKAAKHYEDAAKQHLDAVKHHEDGNHDKALDSSVKAQEYAALAADTQKEVNQDHALSI